ncbi:hypothetical protein ACFVUY_15555 [Kitasatospora sp. NPDC058063]|uniref:hypothetical protein n=1 Tax=unclassified Kitasatospora TaxID=2633591 RepID=UPI0036DCC7E2
MMTIPTADGGTVEITRRGNVLDMHLRDSSGETVATVVWTVTGRRTTGLPLQSLPGGHSGSSRAVNNRRGGFA